MLAKFAKNQYLVSMLKKANTIIFGLIATAFFSRVMGPSVKGQYDTYMNIINILNVLLNLGVSTIYPNYKRKKEKWTETTFIFFSIVQFFLYSIIAVLISFLFDNVTYGIIGFCLSISVLTIQLNNISLVEDYLLNAIANSCSVFINAILAILLYFNGINNIEIIFGCYCVKELSVSLIALICLRKHFRVEAIKWKMIPRVLRTGIIPMLTNLLVMVNYRIDVIFLNIYDINFHQIGLYTAGLGIAEYAWIIPDIFKDVLINKTSRKDDHESVKFCLRAASTFLLITYVALLLFGRIAIGVLYGKNYLDAYKVTNIVFVGVYGMIYCKLLGTIYLAQGKWNFYFYTLLGAVALNVITNNIFIPIMGIYGAAITTIVSYSFAGVIFLISYKRRNKFKYTDLIFINRKDIALIRSFLARNKTKNSYDV